MEHVIALTAGILTAILTAATIRHLRIVAQREAIIARICGERFDGERDLNPNGTAREVEPHA